MSGPPCAEVQPKLKPAEQCGPPPPVTSSAVPIAGMWGFNPISRRYIIRAGPTWARLVKSGAVKDPELEGVLAQRAMHRASKLPDTIAVPRLPAVDELEAKDEKAPRPRLRARSHPHKSAAEEPPAPRPRARVRSEAKAIVDSHLSELDGMESDAALGYIERLISDKLALKQSKQSQSSSSTSRGCLKARRAPTEDDEPEETD
jgi:hypothetical protein